MKKIIYRILLISLFIILAFTIKSHGASDFSYTLDANGNATITAYNGSESNLTIPSTIENHNVVTIGAHAFDESRNSTNGHTIKNLVISEGIQRIELLAFAKCTNLETVKLPESLTFLDMQTFLQCSKLNSVSIPSKIKSIGDGTFQETGFTEFDIPENVKSIDSRALGICSKLEKVRVYSKDISYASGVFEYGSSNLVLYGYEGSTTQTYAQQNGIEFKTLSSSEKPPITIMGSIYLNKDELSLKEDESETLTVSFIEMSSSTKVRWSSSDEKIATVNNGRVTAKSIGKTIITVSTEDGQYKDTCTVSVVKKETSIEEGKNISEKNWIDVIKLSELKENEIYRYTANATTQFPKIENDIGKNCLIYIKDKFDDDYEKEISMYKKISGSPLTISFNEYKPGESFCIMYKKIGNDELLKLIKNDEIIYLSNYKDGDKLEYELEKYIYNNTEKNITINIKDTVFGVETSDSVTIPKGEIYGFNWMIDSAIISYSENNNNDGNNNQDQNEKTDKEQGNKDTTQSTGKLPQTGECITIISVIILVIMIAILTYKKYYKYKDIK